MSERRRIVALGFCGLIVPTFLVVYQIATNGTASPPPLYHLLLGIVVLLSPRCNRWLLSMLKSVQAGFILFGQLLGC
jgi:hypothetical protein